MTAMTAFLALSNGAELPVREVMLYKHGVGYFERSGTLAAGESARLDFKASEMNDVLKSLTIHDAAGAKVTGLRYDSSEPLASRLEEFPFRINEENPSIAGFLNQLRGARVELRSGTDKVAGTIVTARLVPGHSERAERQELVLLLDSGELRTVDLGAVGGISFPDPKLQGQLREYLRVVADARSKEKRSVYIDSADVSSRAVTATYMIPTAVWKSSYRLFLDAKAGPTLEGWAIVDNTTGDDWTNVRLALISGRPVSFISRLYEPRFRQRHIGELPEEQALVPELYQGALAAQGAAGGVIGGIIGQGAEAPPPPPSAAPMALKRQMRDAVHAEAMVVSSVAENTASREVAELFEYRFNSPVTVKRGESAMLPFLQQTIEARKLLIYSDVSQENPMNAAEITNSTGKTLDGGPITVHDGGAYAGEALMGTLKAGDKRLISYAMDLGTRITTEYGSGSEVIRSFRAARGMLTTRAAVRDTRTYVARNVDAKAKTLWIQHEARDRFTLVSPKPAETTRSSYRFEVKLAPNATERLVVLEERELERSTLVANLTPNVLVSYLENTNLSEAGRKQLRQVADAKTRLADINSQLGATRAQTNALERDQQRMRQNIESLNRVSGQNEQVQRYARTLADQEVRIAELRTREGDLESKRMAAESEINSLIERLEF